MKINRKIRFLLVILSALAISSCSCKNKSNNFTKIADELKIIHFLGIDLQGNLLAFDPSGKQIQPCIQQSTEKYDNAPSGAKPCETVLIEKDGKVIVRRRDGREIKQISGGNFKSVAYEGSKCRTSANGKQVESCAPF